MTTTSPTKMKDVVLAWYAANGRDLPWRDTRDPYAILVSEVMLQQSPIGSGTEVEIPIIMRFSAIAMESTIAR